MGLPLKKMLLATALSGLVFLAAAQLCLVKLVDANPSIIMEHIEVSPLVNPTISILSPTENNTLHSSNNLTISFNATIKSESVNVWITRVQYKRSWQPNNITVWWRQSDYLPFYPHPEDIHEYSSNLGLTGIPEGNQTVTITVVGGGSYSNDRVLYYFDAVSYYTVGFTVDTVPPEVSVLELDNKMFVEPEVPLNFTVNESFSKISYALDKQENVTVAGNTTLTGLTFGVHNVTVYAWDTVGNSGASETVFFTITEPEQEPFPTATVAAVSGASAVVVVGAVLAIFFRKRNRQAENDLVKKS
jgi:hypothetical protein